MKLSCQEGLAPGATFAHKLANIEAYGFAGVEIDGSRINDATGLDERKRALADSPVRASSICGGAPAELVHPDPRRRQACLDALRRHVDAAAELGAVGPITVPIFNHNDRVPDLSPWMSRAQVEVELLVTMLDPLAAHAAKAGVCVLLEPLNRYESNALPRQSDGAHIVRRLASPGLRLMCDVFHMHIEETDLPTTLAECADVMAHMHLADNTRLEPGSGCTDFASIMQALQKLGYEGFMAFECGLSGPADEVLPRSVRYLKALVA